MNSLLDEWRFVTQGSYWRSIILSPLIAAAFFGSMFSNNQLSEARVAVIDQDHTAYARQLIEKIDASQYMNVAGIYANMKDPDDLLADEDYTAVIYLPAGLEQLRIAGKPATIGIEMDNTMPSALTNIRSAIQEVVTTENITASTAALRTMGLPDNRVSGLVTPISLQQRLLYNPTSSFIGFMVLGFVNIVALMITTTAAGSVVPRLRQEGRLEEEAQRPIGLLMRMLPYSFLTCVSLLLSYGLLKQVGGMRFVAEPYWFIIPLFAYTTAMSFLGMVIGWSARDRAKMALRTNVILYPSFLVTGVQIAPAIFPYFFQLTALPLPMTWLNKILRGMAFRGGDLYFYAREIGALLLITGICIMVIVFFASRVKEPVASLSD